MSKSKVNRPMWWILVIALGSGGGGGAWAFNSQAHENLQDMRIERNGKTIRRIAVLLVQQGRHDEKMIRAVSKGEEIPDRPAGLDAIESAILAEPID